MIPSIAFRIDQQNSVVGNGDGDIIDGQRMNIPAEEIAQLKEFRKQEYFRQTREEHNFRLLEMEQVEARINQIQVDQERPYGLLRGEAIQDIWEQILDRVHDPEDIANLRNTCQLFRGLLQMKYTTLRLIQVVLKFTNTHFGWRKTMLSLRCVCRSCKMAVEEKLVESVPPYRSYSGNFTINRPRFQLDNVHIQRPHLSLDPWHIQATAWRLAQQNFTNESFPILSVNLFEQGFDEDIIPAFRVLVHQILELIGSRIRWFRLSMSTDGLDTYNQIRSWMPLLPNLEHLELAICCFKDPPPALPPPPFPSCPKLRRFMNEGLGLCFSYIAEILLANPWISEVFILDDHDPASMVVLEEEAIIHFRDALATTQMEWFCLSGALSIPPERFLEFGFQWPLKYLALTITEGSDDTRDSVPSRMLIGFVNAFSATLEELHVNWKLRDNGGYLDLPKVKKLVWKLWPEFMSMEFMIALDGLQYLDLLVGGLQGIGESLENAKTFITDMNLPSLFPALSEIRTNFGHLNVYAYGWHEVWKP